MVTVFNGFMILWHPSGFNVTMFTVLACSPAYIYVCDHVRVLRSVVSVYFSSYSRDW